LKFAFCIADRIYCYLLLEFVVDRVVVDIVFVRIGFADKVAVNYIETESIIAVFPFLIQGQHPKPR
jgi:hypothetical protein